jgi:hypothetical protein
MVPRPLATVALPSRAQLAAAVWRTEDTRRDSGQLVRRIDAARGVPAFLEEDLDGDGRLDHRVWYRQGSPVRGERDLADDGIFESVETWKDGRLWKSAVDTDGDGTPDYTELAGPRPVRLWDYNGDGRDDARQTFLADGSVAREFSTSLDGRFDLRVVFAGARIASVQRDGKPLAVQVDPRHGLVWIGRAAVAPSGAFPSLDAAPPDGFRLIGGRRYLVFRHEGTLYAEELR